MDRYSQKLIFTQQTIAVNQISYNGPETQQYNCMFIQQDINVVNHQFLHRSTKLLTANIAGTVTVQHLSTSLQCTTYLHLCISYRDIKIYLSIYLSIYLYIYICWRLEWWAATKFIRWCNRSLHPAHLFSSTAALSPSLSRSLCVSTRQPRQAPTALAPQSFRCDGVVPGRRWRASTAVGSSNLAGAACISPRAGPTSLTASCRRIRGRITTRAFR